MEEKSQNDFLTVIQDENIRSEDYLNVFTSNRETTFRKGMYVKIEDQLAPSNQFWIGCIATSNANICPAVPKATDQTMLIALEDSNQKKEVIDGFGVSQYFSVKLLKIATIEPEIKDENEEIIKPTLYNFEPVNYRPTYGSKVYKLNSNEIIELLKTPRLNTDKTNAIGFCKTIEDLPICLTKKEFHTHILVSGTTGSGKSNINGNLIKIAQKLNKPVIIHDAKPDFSLMEMFNIESRTAEKSQLLKEKEKSYGFKERQMINIIKIGFFGIHNTTENYKQDNDIIVKFYVSDFTPEELSQIFFYEEGEDNQREEFLYLLKSYYCDKETNQITDIFDIKHLLDLINKSMILTSRAEKDYKDRVFCQLNNHDKLIVEDLKNKDQRTRTTIINKINRRLLLYPWLILNKHQPQKLKLNPEIDHSKILNKLKTEMKEKKSQELKLEKLQKNPDMNLLDMEEAEFKEIDKNFKKFEKRIFTDRLNRNKEVDILKNNVIEIIKEKIKNAPPEKAPIFLIDYNFPNSDITYSFMVNKLLSAIQSMQDSKDAHSEGIVQVVDEAHRLFNGLSKNFKDELMNSLNKVIKEGRVKKHSLILSLQNASEVPSTALNNFGTKIALRQQTIEEARISTQGMGENAIKDVMNLSPGQFLIKYPAGEFTFLSQAFMSPFQLRIE